MSSVVLAEIWRGQHQEGEHRGHVVIADPGGQIVSAWGDPDHVIFPRSSCKMLQALPLVDSGAADRAGVTQAELALACASHDGGQAHTSGVIGWMDRLGLAEPDLRCGPQMPADKDARARIRAGAETRSQLHNNCSGKHAGFLTLSRDLGAGPEYVDPSHPVQRAVLTAFEEMTDETSPGYGFDGCSAPNFLCTLSGLAFAAARMADPSCLGPARGATASRLVQAMIRHPDLVAGEGRAPTALMRAAAGKAAIKDGAEGVYVAILPERKLGIAIKVEDGAQRAADAAVAGLLVRLGILDRADPAATAFAQAPVLNRRDMVVGEVRAAALA